MNIRLMALACAVPLMGASLAAGSTFRLELGPPVAANAPNMKKGTAFVVRGLACDAPAAMRIAAVAEGVVNGSRQSVAIELLPLAATDAYAVPAAWRDAAPRVISLTAWCGDATAGAVVPFGPAGFTREKSRVLDRAPVRADIDAALAALGAR